jgi:hypothetical protein
MVACGTCAGVGDDRGEQSDDSHLAANRNGARKTCRQDAAESLMKDFSLSSAQAIGGAWGIPLRPSTPFDERYGQW